MAKNNSKIIFAGLTGLLAGLAYSYPSWGFLIWFSFVPLLLVLTKISRRSYQTRFLYGFLAGSVYFLFTFRWFWSLYPLDAYGVTNGFYSLLFIGVLWLLTSLVLAVAWGCWTAIADLNKKSGLFLTVTVFVLFEYLRSYFIGVLWYGSESLIGPHWTLGNIGYALAGNHFALWLSSYVGIYGIVLVIITVNLIFFTLLNGKKNHSLNQISLLAIVLILSLLAVLPKVIFRTSNSQVTESIQLAIIQTNQQHRSLNDSANLLSSFKENLGLLNQAAKNPNTTVIIFPEGSNLFANLSAFLTPAQAKKYFDELTNDPKLVVDNSTVLANSVSAYSRVVYLNTKQDILGYYDKKLLTPGGEFLPYGLRVIFKLLAINTDDQGTFVRGTQEQQVVFGKLRPQALVCSDLFSPSLVRDKAGTANLLLVMSSTASFHGSKALISQILAINRFRAAENKISLVLAANDGLSYILDNGGNVSKIASNRDTQILTGQALLASRKSWYNKVGDWPVLLALLAILAIHFLERPTRQLHNKTNESET